MDWSVLALVLGIEPGKTSCENKICVIPAFAPESKLLIFQLLDAGYFYCPKNSGMTSFFVTLTCLQGHLIKEQFFLQFLKADGGAQK